MKRALRGLAAAGLVASLFAPLGAHATYQCVGAADVPAGVCAADRISRSVFMRFVKGPATVIVEAEKRAGETNGTYICVKVFMNRSFVMNCSTSVMFTIDDSLDTVRIDGRMSFPKYGSVALTLVSKSLDQPPRLHKQDMQESVGTFCDTPFAQASAPVVARDAGATGNIRFGRSLGTFAARPAQPAPASHRLKYLASAAVGLASGQCKNSAAPDYSLYRLLTCGQPLCTGLERGALVVAQGTRSRVTLIAMHEDGTETAERIQSGSPAVPPAPGGMDCLGVMHKTRHGWGQGYAWCEPGLLKATVDPALRTATMKTSVTTPDLGRLKIDLAFAAADEAVRNRPAGFAAVSCFGAYGHTQAPLRDVASSVTGSVSAPRFPSVRFSGGVPLRGLMWNRTYATYHVWDRNIPDQC